MDLHENIAHSPIANPTMFPFETPQTIFNEQILKTELCRSEYMHYPNIKHYANIMYTPVHRYPAYEQAAPHPLSVKRD